MKSITDLFIEKPVLSGVVSLLILILGLRSIESLELRQYPKTEDTVITVTTSLPGADSDSVKSFITTPLQQVIAETSGIDYIKATSLKFLSIDGLYKALVNEKRNIIYPQFSDHYFTGEYPIKPSDNLRGLKVKQLSLLSGKSNN